MVPALQLQRLWTQRLIFQSSRACRRDPPQGNSLIAIAGRLAQTSMLWTFRGPLCSFANAARRILPPLIAAIRSTIDSSYSERCISLRCDGMQHKRLLR